MEAWQWALVLKPAVAVAVTFLVVAPIMWILYKLIPPGRLKTILFKVRDGPEATRRDLIVHWLAVLAAFAFFAAVGALIWVLHPA